MSDHVYKTLELVGSSAKSPEDAVRTAIAKANQTVRNLRWFEVVETRGHIEKRLRPARGAKSPSASEWGWGPASAEQCQIAHWQVVVKLGFTLED